MVNPLVTVVLPSYNRPESLKRSVQSVLEQTYPNLELIIVDDASTVNYFDILRHIPDARIRYIKHRCNEGPAAARNTAIRASKGELLAFNDDDVLWHHEKLSRQVEALAKASPDVALVFCSHRRMELDGTAIFPRIRTDHLMDWHALLLAESFIDLPTVLIRRECLDNCGLFDSNLRALEDWDLFIRLSRHYACFHLNQELLVSYQSANSVSSHPERNALAIERILTKNLTEISSNPILLAEYCWRIGTSFYASGQYGRSSSYFLKSAMTRPRFGTMYRLLCSILRSTICLRTSNSKNS